MPSIQQLKRLGLTVVVISSMIGCADYSFSVNENVVYTPPALLQDFQVEDKMLENCLQENIIDQNVSAAEQLTTLHCSNSNIQSLAGIGVFSNLQQINFSHNMIEDLAPLIELPELTTLLFNSNEITSLDAVAGLGLVERAEFLDNPALQCPEQDIFNNRVWQLPKHCQR
ncbi:hypothetical protein SIN8267_00715 [Sinobacterium norvegicum]|uniref:Leucine-rich repeat domain-containing protein n=1 Tax=Sinobacterium norvegicum TaxID=1641715 RepID=A0ABM9ACB2_9GAMM|nr:leucine-rich repeat domain-containing protein [Sinobacterium norvegicum]CAH0990621.1 hypothetical protein SIN8267_00715 [Sinobacterium norvegicum]